MGDKNPPSSVYCSVPYTYMLQLLFKHCFHDASFLNKKRDMKKGRNEVLKLGPKGTQLAWLRRLYGNVIFISIIIILQLKMLSLDRFVFRKFSSLSFPRRSSGISPWQAHRQRTKRKRTQFEGKQQINCAPTVIIASFPPSTNSQDEQQGNKRI